MHFLSCDNIHNLPGDPWLLGYSVLSQSKLTIKAFAAEQANSQQLHSDTQYLVVDSDSKPAVVSREQAEAAGLQPSLIHSINCIVKTDFLFNPDFKKQFNYMEKYKFNKMHLQVFDTKICLPKQQDCYRAAIPFDCFYKEISSWDIYVEAGSKFAQIADLDSFRTAQASYLKKQQQYLEQNKLLQGIVENNASAANLFPPYSHQPVQMEVDPGLYYSYEDIATCPISKVDVIANKLMFK